MNKGKWDRFKKTEEGAEELTSVLTMNLRCVVTNDGQYIEQMVEHRNAKGMVVNTEWVAIPTLYVQG